MQAAGLDAGQVIRWKSWHRWTAVYLLAYPYLAVAAAAQRQQEASSSPDAGLIPAVTVPELLRLLPDTVIPPPRRNRAHRPHWSERRRLAPCPPGPPALEHLRRDNTMITTNYSCRSSAAAKAEVE